MNEVIKSFAFAIVAVLILAGTFFGLYAVALNDAKAQITEDQVRIAVQNAHNAAEKELKNNR